jgi:putative glutamine transport system substrate-binding protein
MKMKKSLIAVIAVIAVVSCTPKNNSASRGSGASGNSASSNETAMRGVSPVGDGVEPQKYAVVIGNGTYANITKLSNPVNDANDMKAALQGLGFTVDTVINGSRVRMEEAVERFKNRLSVSRNSYGFFFYAGHGVQSSGINYLIPVDADIRSESYLGDRAVSVQAMLDEINRAGNELNIVVLDACRDNPFGWSRSGARGLQVLANQPADSIIVYATSAGTTAADGTGRNGLFTSQLLNNLKTPGLEVNEIFRLTMGDVARASNNAQRPAVYNQFPGIAYLGSRPSAQTAQPVQPVVPPPQRPAPVQPAAQPQRPIPDTFVRISGGTFTMRSTGNAGADRIIKAGLLKVGVKSDVPGFGLLNPETGKYEGMEIDMAHLIAEELFGDRDRVAFTPVTAKTRGPLLDNGDIDFVIATFTVTEERKLTYNFSSIYYTDGVGLLVKKAAGYTGLESLGGKTIGVAQSATIRQAIIDGAAPLGVTVRFAEFATYPEIKAALDSGRVDAFSVDKAILRAYLDSSVTLLPDTYMPQPYGIAGKLQNKELASWIDGLIQTWLEDGTIQALITKYDL